MVRAKVTAYGDMDEAKVVAALKAAGATRTRWQPLDKDYDLRKERDALESELESACTVIKEQEAMIAKLAKGE